MDTHTMLPIPTSPDHLSTEAPAVSRRGFLRGAALAGGGLVAVGVAACEPATSSPAGWTFGPTLGAPGASGGTSAGPSGSPAAAAFFCDTLGVNPGERWDVVIDCDEVGAWAFHCHILPHAEGHDGMFGMVTALVVQAAASASLDVASTSPAIAAARAAGSTATICRIPTAG